MNDTEEWKDERKSEDEQRRVNSAIQTAKERIQQNEIDRRARERRASEGVQVRSAKESMEKLERAGIKDPRR